MTDSLRKRCCNQAAYVLILREKETPSQGKDGELLSQIVNKLATRPHLGSTFEHSQH